jgi:hypothetical protein
MLKEEIANASILAFSELLFPQNEEGWFSKVI